MTSLAKFMRDEGNALIFATLGEIAVIDGEAHEGVFNNRPRQIEFEDGSIMAVDITFACSYTEKIRRLREGDPIVIKYESTEEGTRYCFRRRIPSDGDETDLVTLELGAL
jgi:hypothetical protein